MMPSWITPLKRDIDSDVKFLLRQTQVKFRSQRPRPHFQVFGLHFSAFPMFIIYFLMAGHAYCTVPLVHFEFNFRSWQVNLNLILSSLHTVGHQILRLGIMPPCFDLNLVLPLVKQLWVTFCDAFEK